MIGEAIQSETLKALVSQQAIREAVGRFAEAVGIQGFSVEL